MDEDRQPPASTRLQACDIQGNNPSRLRWKRCLSTCKFLITDQWFLFALGFFILLASQVQVPRSQQAKKELIVTYLCVALIFFVTGCTLPTNVLIENSRRWRLHIFVQIQSFLLTSVIVFAVVSLSAINQQFMDAGLLVGMIFTGCVPTTISSNVIMTKQANGNQALTVVQSTLGNFLGPFLSPLLVIMYTSTGTWYTKILPDVRHGEFGELYSRVFMQLGLSIFLPLVQKIVSITVLLTWLNLMLDHRSSYAEHFPECNAQGSLRLEAFETRILVSPNYHMANV